MFAKRWIVAVLALVAIAPIAEARTKIVVRRDNIIVRDRFVHAAAFFAAPPAIVFPAQAFTAVGVSSYTYGAPAQFVAPAPAYTAPASENLLIEREKTKQEEQKTEQIRLQLRAK